AIAVGHRRRPGGLPRRVGEEEVVAHDQAPLEHEQQQESDEGEDQGQLHGRLPPVPPPRPGHFTFPITSSMTTSKSFPTAPDLVAQPTRSRAMPAAPSSTSPYSAVVWPVSPWPRRAPERREGSGWAAASTSVTASR